MAEGPGAGSAGAENVPGGRDPSRAVFLQPGTCRLYVGPLEELHVSIEGGHDYGGVVAVYLFPVSHMDRYISLVHQTSADEPDAEIGIIRDLSVFAEDQAKLVRDALARRYFIHTITRIKEMGWKFGFVHIQAETDKGDVDFLMRWQQDRAVDYGRRGKVLIDVDDNRYLIPDIEKLTSGEQQAFTRIIYW